MLFNLQYEYIEKLNDIDNTLYDVNWSTISSKILRQHNINDVDDESVKGQTLSYSFAFNLIPSSYYYYKAFKLPYHIGYAFLALQKKYGLKTKVDGTLFNINYKLSVTQALTEMIDLIFSSGVEIISTKNILNYPDIKNTNIVTVGRPYIEVNFGIVYNNVFSMPVEKNIKISDYVNKMRKELKVNNDKKLKLAYTISFIQKTESPDEEQSQTIRKFDVLHTIMETNGDDLLNKEIYDISFNYFATIAYEEGASRIAQACAKTFQKQLDILSKA